MNQIEQFKNANFLTETFSSLIPILTVITTSMSLMNTLQMVMTSLRKKDSSALTQQISKEGSKTAVQTGGMIAGIIDAFKSGGIPGIIAGIATAISVVAMIASVAGIAIGGISAAVKSAKAKDDSAETAAKEINDLSNSIYKLQEKANAISQITSSFDSLDNKIIQTNKDVEEMSSLLEQAADKLDDDVEDDENIGYGEGISEKEYYQQLDDNSKREFLDQIEQEARTEAKQKRDEQIDYFRNNSDLLNENTTNAEIKKAQTSIYANAVYNLQDYIDTLKDAEGVNSETASAIETMTEAMIRQANLSDALDFADDENQVKALVNQIKDLEIQVEDAKGELQDISTAEILTSDDYGIRDKARAFNELKQELGESSEEYQLFAAAYKDYETFAEMGDDVLKMVEYLELSIDEIDQLGTSYKTLKSYGLDMSEEAFKNSITGAGGVLDTLAKTGGDVESTVKRVFGTVLSSADDYEKTYNAIVNSLSAVLSRGMLNMGQDITKLKNTVNGFYEKATE
jgi:hypothetical protein